MKIGVNTESIKKQILRNSVKLRGEDKPAHMKKIFITPDLTPTEQKLNNKLRAELKVKNKGGNLFKIKKQDNSAAEFPLSLEPCTGNFLMNQSSVNHKQAIFGCFVDTHNPDIIFGTESWMSPIYLVVKFSHMDIVFTDKTDLMVMVGYF